ncbi:MAG: hypothetical protein PHV82_07190 [Victivallaceae bacterium]|nr:hypothetical protein [Victivallaceae bacterium]
MYIAIVFIIFWAMVYRYIGETEYGNGVLLPVLSVLLALATFFVLGWGLPGCLLAQLGIGAVLTLIKIFRKEPPEA